MFSLCMLFFGVFCAYAISETLKEKGFGSKLFLWFVLSVCSFFVGGDLAITISNSWNIPLNLKSDLHGIDIVKMLIVTGGAGAIFLFGLLQVLKSGLLIITSTSNSIKAMNNKKGEHTNVK